MTQQDYEELVNKPRKSTSSQLEVLERGGRAVALTPDDILTLRLLGDDHRRERSFHNTDKSRNIETDRLLETLERILKQVE